MNQDTAEGLLREVDAALRKAWDDRTLPADVYPSDLAWRVGQFLRPNLPGISRHQVGGLTLVCVTDDSLPPDTFELRSGRQVVRVKVGP